MTRTKTTPTGEAKAGKAKPAKASADGRTVEFVPLEEDIRIESYLIWERAGKPHGRDAEFWQQARVELIARNATPSPAKSTSAKKTPEKKTPEKKTAMKKNTADLKTKTTDSSSRVKNGRMRTVSTDVKPVF